MSYTKYLLLLAGFAAISAGQVRVTVDVPANRAWTKTGINIERGNTVVIDATGQIEAVSDADTRPLFHHVPPEGRAERQENKPQPTMRALVMLASIGDGPITEAGAHTEFTADRAGELQLGINDNNVNDNTGAWRAQVTVRPSATTSTQQGTRRTQDSRPLSGSPAPQDQYREDATRGDSRQQGASNEGARNGNPPNYRDQSQPQASNRPYGNSDADRYRPEDQYRPNYRSSDYYRRYGHGFGVDEAVRVCQQSVLTEATRRFRTPDIHFNRTRIDDNPGRDDWVIGTLDIHYGPRQERFGFSCSVDFDNGRLRSAKLDSRPLPDDPRGR